MKRPGGEQGRLFGFHARHAEYERERGSKPPLEFGEHSGGFLYAQKGYLRFYVSERRDSWRLLVTHLLLGKVLERELVDPDPVRAVREAIEWYLENEHMESANPDLELERRKAVDAT